MDTEGKGFYCSDEIVEWLKGMASESSGDIIPDRQFRKLLSEIIVKDKAVLEEIGRL